MIIEFNHKYFIFDKNNNEPNHIFYEICWLHIYFIEYIYMTHNEAIKWSNIYKNIKYHKCKYDTKIHNNLDKMLQTKGINYKLS